MLLKDIYCVKIHTSRRLLRKTKNRREVGHFLLPRFTFFASSRSRKINVMASNEYGLFGIFRAVIFFIVIVLFFLKVFFLHENENGHCKSWARIRSTLVKGGNRMKIVLSQSGFCLTFWFIMCTVRERRKKGAVIAPFSFWKWWWRPRWWWKSEKNKEKGKNFLANLLTSPFFIFSLFCELTLWLLLVD